MPTRPSDNPLFDLLRRQRQAYDAGELMTLFQKTDAERVRRLAKTLGEYIASNLPIRAVDLR